MAAKRRWAKTGLKRTNERYSKSFILFLDGPNFDEEIAIPAADKYFDKKTFNERSIWMFRL